MSTPIATRDEEWSGELDGDRWRWNVLGWTEKSGDGGKGVRRQREDLDTREER